MTQVMHGIVHGWTIKFEQEVGVSEGQEVEVFIRPLVAMPDGTQPFRWTDE